jgi:type I restriction enzyme R subunit
VLTLHQEDAAKETTEDGKKRANRRFADALLALSKAFALAAASDAARSIREEVGLFQAIPRSIGQERPRQRQEEHRPTGTRDPADREPRRRRPRS